MRDLPRPWLWLFPVTCAVHILEEGLAGERFYRWIGHLSGRVISPMQFWTINGALWVVMCVVVICRLRSRTGRLDFVEPGLGTVVAVNGLVHLMGTILSGIYSPGVVSGLLLWVPLGSYALLHSRQKIDRRQWWLGVGAGFLAQAAASVLVIGISSHA